MRAIGIRLPLLVVSVFMGWGLSVWAMDLRYGETVYLLPTTTTVSVPTVYVETSSVAGRSSLMPTALVVPSYYPTAYAAEELLLSPTAYVETRYRRGLLGRLFRRERLVERSVIASYPAYVPTSFAWPTAYPTSYSVARDDMPTVFDSRVTYETAYPPSSASPCEEVASTWRVPVRETPSVRVLDSAANPGTKQVESKATDESTISSNVNPVPGANSVIPKPRSSEETIKAKSTGSEADSPPDPPLPEKVKDSSTNASGATGQPQTKGAASKDVDKDKDAVAPLKAPADITPKTQLKPPVLPTGDKDDPELVPAPGANNSGTSRREVGKPIYPTTTIRPERRNVLFGKVESSAAGQPEEEVRVIVSSRSNRAIRKEGMSDAYGRFAIKLSEGDWTVNVTMPSGRVYPVSQITVSGGRIFDEREGREIPSLIITR